MRVYRCVPGRLPALLQRFETITLEIWKRHGIRQAGFWTTLVGESNQDLIYLLAWTERDGPIVQNITNAFLAPTAFSSVR